MRNPSAGQLVSFHSLSPDLGGEPRPRGIKAAEMGTVVSQQEGALVYPFVHCTALSVASLDA